MLNAAVMLLGALFCFALGLVYLFGRDRVWQWQRARYLRRGVWATRTRAWDMTLIILGGFLILVAVLIAIRAISSV